MTWHYTHLRYSFPSLEPAHSMYDSNCCFLTCIQISQGAGQVVWYSHIFKHFSVCSDPTQWTWVWVSYGSWRWTGKPGMLQSMGLQRAGHDWATELIWTELNTVKGFGIVNKAEVDVFLEFSCFFDDPVSSVCQSIGVSASASVLPMDIQEWFPLGWMLAIWSLLPLPFLNSAWTSRSSWFMDCWSLARRILSVTLLLYEMSTIVW